MNRLRLPALLPLLLAACAAAGAPIATETPAEGPASLPSRLPAPRSYPPAPLATSTSSRYPPPPTAGLPPTWPPKPTQTPTTAPSPTIAPTALALPTVPYAAVWSQTVPWAGGLDPLLADSVLWWADPRDIASKRKVARFEMQVIVALALSPNGRQVALTTYGWKRTALYLADLDGGELRLLGEAGEWAYPNTYPGGPTVLHWSPDGSQLAYDFTWREPGEHDWRYVSAIEVLDLAGGERHRLAQTPPEAYAARLLGWSADGRALYYLLGEAGPRGELWAVEADGSHPRRIAAQAGGWPAQAPDRGAFRLGLTEWLSADGSERRTVWAGADSSRSFWPYTAMSWTPDSRGWLISGLERDRQMTLIRRLDVATGNLADLVSIPTRAGYDWWPLALAPDSQWLALYSGGGGRTAGLVWVYIPTGDLVPAYGDQFAGWAPRVSP